MSKYRRLGLLCSPRANFAPKKKKPLVKAGDFENGDNLILVRVLVAALL